MKTEIIKIDPSNIERKKVKRVVEFLREGKLVILPTETVYGVGANSKIKEAVDRLYEIKKRPKDKPFSLAISDFETAERLTKDISPLAYKLIERFWPGPLTLILEAVDSERSIGFRIPKNNITLKVLSELKAPVYLPSANISGELTPTKLEEALRDLDGLVDLAIDGGETELKCESTVVDLTIKPYRILRERAIKREEIERTAKLKTILFVCTGNSCRSVMAKSLLERLLRDREDIEILACGTLGLKGIGASRETIELLKREGIDVSEHKAVGLEDSFLKKSDLILVMERHHEEIISERAPQIRNRVFLLREFAKIEGTELNIPDPIGRSSGFYEKVFLMIKEAIERVAQLI